MVVFCSGKNRRDPGGYLHTNFRINKDRETITLADHSGKISDSVTVHRLADDISYARKHPVRGRSRSNPPRDFRIRKRDTASSAKKDIATANSSYGKL